MSRDPSAHEVYTHWVEAWPPVRPYGGEEGQARAELE